MKDLGRKSRRGINDINVVPYIDVMLVLLVIFMVTAPMVTPSVIDLPSMSSANVPKQTRPIEVSIKQVGKKLLVLDHQTNESREVTLNNLADEVKRLQGADTERPVVISAEKSIQYQSVVDTMDVLQQAAIPKVGLLVKPKG